MVFLIPMLGYPLPPHILFPPARPTLFPSPIHSLLTISSRCPLPHFSDALSSFPLLASSPLFLCPLFLSSSLPLLSSSPLHPCATDSFLRPVLSSLSVPLPPPRKPVPLSLALCLKSAIPRLCLCLCQCLCLCLCVCVTGVSCVTLDRL